MDRLVEDELVAPRKLGVELTQRQEEALLRGMGVAPKRRFQSMEEFHTALYEGFAPNPAGGKGDEETSSAPAPADAPAGDETEQTMDMDSAMEETALPQWMGWLRKNWMLAGGGLAALALVVLLAVVLPRLLGPSVDDPAPTQTTPGTPGVEDTDPPVQSRSPAPVDLSFSANKTPQENGMVLLALLADDSVETVIVPGTVDVRVDEPVTLTKPLRIGPGGSNTSFALPLTVAAGGGLEIMGSVDCNTLLRTMDGGTVVVRENAQLGCANVWLERANSLTAIPGANVNYWGGGSPDQDPWEKSHRLTLDEKSLFADAVHVSSEEEFARNCQGGKPLMIDGEITLTQWYETRVPILILEGSVLAAPCDEGGADCTLDVLGQAVVNRGTIRGRMSLIGSYEDVNQVPALVNYGQIDGCLNTYDGPATVINLGGIAFADSAAGTANVSDVNLINLGQITTTPNGRQDIRGHCAFNCGTITVPAGAEIALSTDLSNQGEITVERGGRLIASTYLWNGASGTVLVRSGGTLEVPGLLEVEAGQVAVETGGTLSNSGVVQYGADTLELAEGVSITGDGHLIPFSFNDPATFTDAVRFVNNERDLRQALVNPAVSVVVWNDQQNQVEFTGGDLAVDKGLIVQSPNDRPGAFQGANITVTGENAFVILNTPDFGGGALRVENGATVRLAGEGRNLGGLTAADGGLICIIQGAAYVRDGQVSATGGGRIVNASSMELAGCRVDVGEGSRLCGSGGLSLEGCDVTIDGELVCANWPEMPDGSLTNNGLADLSGGCHLGGRIVNNGIMRLTVGHLSGELVNAPGGQILLLGSEGIDLRGTLDNQGHTAVGEDGVETVPVILQPLLGGDVVFVQFPVLPIHHILRNDVEQKQQLAGDVLFA